MKKLLDELIEKLSVDRKLQPNIETMEENRKLETVLKAILTTVELGFWQSMDELANIISYCQNLLANDSQFTIALTGKKLDKDPQNEVEKAYEDIKKRLQKPSRENILVINCKLMATKIIECILDYELDLRVLKTCKMFKALTINPSSPEISKASEV